MTSSDSRPSFNWLRLIYGGFLVLAAYSLFRSDYSSALSQAGIALAFDPFNPQQNWKERPLWQKGWLGIHLALVFFLLGWVLFR